MRKRILVFLALILSLTLGACSSPSRIPGRYLGQQQVG